MTLTTQSPFAFPKAVRLLGAHQFRRVNKYGKTTGGKYLTIQVCVSKNSSLKLGLTVSRKYGDAVRRNRFKRLVREAFRLSQHSLPPRLHLNIRPTAAASGATLSEIREELIHLCTALERI
ncbi:ribonuclease P protein component [Chlamydiota bacterium]